MSRKISKQEIVNRFKDVHGERYDYFKFEYFTKKTPSTIICRIHGDFLQRPFHHLLGSGCPKCAGVPVGGFKRTTKEDFFKKIPDNLKSLYDFSKFEFKNINTKGIVVCSLHGEFLKTPKKLYAGQGCPECSGKKKLSKENIQSRLNTIHGEGLYSVDKFAYVNNKTPGIITCNKHGDWMARPDNLLNAETRCPKCFSTTSKAELEIKSFISELGVDYKSNDKAVISPLELDIFIKDKNLAIEYNGLYYHSELSGNKDKLYHKNKTVKCEELDINLIQIFEDEWITKKNIVKSILKSKLGFISNRIYARKCTVKHVDAPTASRFLADNHIQGHAKSTIKLGLYYSNDLVAIMTFCESRFDRNYKWEISRFCNKLDTVVVGGSSKLFKFFARLYPSDNIISYADKRYSQGNMYRKIGMVESPCESVNYYYFNKHDLIRYSRQKFQKHKLEKLLPVFDPNLSEWENMKLNGYDRIWDCGNKKFVWNPDLI